MSLTLQARGAALRPSGMPKIAFLGSGNMASAFVGGLLSSGTEPANLVCYSGSGKTALVLAERTGIQQVNTLAELMQDADTLVVAFKPQHLAAEPIQV